MFKRYYHCFVAGLWDLGFDDGKTPVSLTGFREELQYVLHEDDYALVKILFLPYDNANLIRFMSGRSFASDSPGNFTFEDFSEQINRLDSIVKMDNVLPDYMVSCISEWLNSEKTMNLIEAEKKLTEGYYDIAMNSGNLFLKSWAEFEMNVNNILVLKNVMETGIDGSMQLIGNNEFTEELKAITCRKCDFTMPPEPDYAETIFNIAEQSEFLERELKIDMLKWNFVNDKTFFEYFTIGFILGYLVKLLIALRWKSLDNETGEKMLKRLVTELTESKESQSI
jgi:hypothetical protein